MIFCNLTLTAEGTENGHEFTIVRPFNCIEPRMEFIPGIDGPSEGVPRFLPCFSNVSCLQFYKFWPFLCHPVSVFTISPLLLQNFFRRRPLKLVDGGHFYLH